MNLIASTHIYGSNVEYIEGKFVQMEVNRSEMDFVLVTENRQHMHFQCDNYCHASPAHIERHLLEHSGTDIYYVEQPGNRLLAVDVD